MFKCLCDVYICGHVEPQSFTVDNNIHTSLTTLTWQVIRFSPGENYLFSSMERCFYYFIHQAYISESKQQKYVYRVNETEFILSVS